MKSFLGIGFAGFCIFLITPEQALAEIAGLERIAFGLDQPVFATYAPGDQDRLFIVEKGGSIKLWDLNTSQLIGDFLTIPDTVDASEGGLLGLAFHPDYATNGKFYVNVTVDNGGVSIDGETSPFSTRIREYTVSANPNEANTSPTEVISWAQPKSNHNGGWIGFNPKTSPEQSQYLYINSGDGGKQGDPDNNAQTIVNEPLGKILRLDINGNDFPADNDRNYAIPASNPFVGETGDDEIWSYGLRNPWRASFDRANGDFWIGDVGQNTREEINHQLGSSIGGENYGWQRREGSISHQGGALLPGDVEPVYDYSHGSGDFQGNSVVGGYVYRGPDPDVQGRYFFADSISANVWQFDPANPTGTVENIDSQLIPDIGSKSFPVSFGEDAVGNLYLIDIGGDVFRLVTDNLLPGDYTADGLITEADYDAWKSSYGSSIELEADGNGNGIVDAADYTVWRDNWVDPPIGSETLAATAVPEPATLGIFVIAMAFAIALEIRHRTSQVINFQQR